MNRTYPIHKINGLYREIQQHRIRPILKVGTGAWGMGNWELGTEIFIATFVNAFFMASPAKLNFLVLQ